MSLKAKIEAVIYASEEPVTLAQLVSLLSEEAQAELDALAAQQESLPLEQEQEEAASASDPEALNAETTGEPVDSAEPAEQPAELSAEPAPEAQEQPAQAPEAADGPDAKADAAANRARERRLRDYF